MEMNKFYDYDWAINNIFENDNILFERRIDYIFYYLSGYDDGTEVYAGRIPEKSFFHKFWKWMIDNLDDYTPESVYWYNYFRDKSSKTNISEDLLFYDEFTKFDKAYKKEELKMSSDELLYSQHDDCEILQVFLANKKPGSMIKERKVSYLFYIFLGRDMFLKMNRNIDITTNIIFKFGDWLFDKYPEYDKNEIGIFWYLIIEKQAVLRNKDELELLVELFKEFFHNHENKNITYDDKTGVIHETNSEGSIRIISVWTIN